MDRFDAVVAAAVGGLSGQEMGEASIAKAAVKIATLVEHELAHLKELQRSERAEQDKGMTADWADAVEIEINRHRREVDADALADYFPHPSPEIKDDEER